MEEPVKFAPQVPRIFRELEPALMALAHRYKAPNPRDTVKGWMSRAYEIVNRFDEGELKKKIYASDDSQEEMITFDPACHHEEKFIKSLKNYLKHCFTNDIIRIYNLNKKRHERREDVGSVATSQYSKTGFSAGTGLLKYDSISLESIVKIIQIDAERAEKNTVCLLELIHSKFLQALLQYCLALQARGEDWKRLVVVPDLEEKDNKKFFSADFRCDLEDGVRREIAKLIVVETNPLIIERLGILISRENKGTLQKRLFRYFFKYHRGFPERLRARVQNRTL